ncbi:hypothetical protein HaLaN_18175, partial [Haematococcus lacustris]
MHSDANINMLATKPCNPCSCDFTAKVGRGNGREEYRDVVMNEPGLNQEPAWCCGIRAAYEPAATTAGQGGVLVKAAGGA